jgi:hypothetical protein
MPPSTESADDALPRKDAAMSGTATGPNGTNGPDKSIANIYEQNQIWKNTKLDEDKDFFKKLGSEHAPDYMWIGKCNSSTDWLVGWSVDARILQARFASPSQSSSV